MASKSPTKTKKDQNGATVGWEQQLWQATDGLRNILLPKLISGDLHLKDVKHFVESAE